MGMTLAWVAAQGVERDTFFEMADLADTGEADEAFQAEYAGASLADGWQIVVSEDLELLDPELLEDWSQDARIVAVLVDEDARFSMASEWRGGALTWSVSHDVDEGEAQVAVSGALPPEFEAARRQCDAREAAGDAGAAFSLPLDVAAGVVAGFRHDSMGFDANGPVFNELEPL